MKPPVETIRISKLGRDQLVKLRRQTGIEHWNILCRWAFCVSLREPTPPQNPHEKLEGGVEMTWKVFAGENSEIFAALNTLRAANDGYEATQEGLGACLRAHIHRGLGYLASGTQTRSISDFILRWAATD